jgi:hypothetical protein
MGEFISLRSGINFLSDAAKSAGIAIDIISVDTAEQSTAVGVSENPATSRYVIIPPTVLKTNKDVV